MRTLKQHQRTKKKIIQRIDGSGSTNSVFQIIGKQVIQHGEKKIPRLLTPNFPLFNPQNFVGRKSSLNELHQNLQQGNQTVLMNGLGGIGKTSVAQMYCHLHHKDYQHFVWVSQIDTFENAWLNAIGLQKNLEVAMTDNPEQTVRNMLNALNNIAGNNLLILDNADSSLRPYVDELPKTWHILLTSREKMSDKFTEQRLGVISFEEAKKLFEQYYTKASFIDEQLKALCEEIGYHTLTLELLAKTLQESFELTTITELIEYLQNNRLADEALQEKININHHSKEEVEIYTHLIQAFTLATLSDEEKWLLLQFAVMPPIPHEAKAFLQWTQQENSKPYAAALKTLHKKGWLDRKDDTFHIHRMIQTLIRYQTPPTYGNCRGLVDSFHDLLELDQAKDNPIDKFQYIEYGTSLCNHISDNQEQVGSLNNWTASTFEDIGDYKNAEKYYKNAISIATAMNDVTNINAYNNNLAIVYRNMGRYEEAANLLEIALMSAKKNLGDNHPSIATSQSNLANVYADMGRYEEAANLLEIALMSAKKNLGDNHPSVATRQSNLANVYADMGRYEEAANLLEIALKSDLKNFGDNHPSVATRQSNLANVYADMGRYEEAANLLEIALMSAKKNFGDNHPSVATRQSNLANVYLNMGRYEEAANLLEIALKSAKKNLGDNHPSVATRQSNLANVYLNMGRYEEAANLLEIALMSDLKNLGDNHPSVATRQSNLANVYLNMGRYEEAANLLEIALMSDLKNLGDNHPSVATRLNNLAYVYFHTKEYQKAKEAFEKAYFIALEALGEQHPNTKNFKQSLEAIKTYL